MSKSSTVNKYGFNPFANGGCQSLLQSTRMGSTPLLMVDVKSTTSTRMGSHPLLVVDVKVYCVIEYGFTPFANGRCQSLLRQQE